MAAAVVHGNAGHRLRQGGSGELAVLEHFQAGGDLGNDDLVDALPVHALFGQDLVSDIFDDGIAGNGHILASQFLHALGRLAGAGNQLVAAIGEGGDLHIKAAGFGEGHRQHIRNGTVQIAALQGRIAIHGTLVLLDIHLEAFLVKIALLPGNDERQGIRVRHQADGQGLERLGLLLLAGLLSAPGQENCQSHNQSR